MNINLNKIIKIFTESDNNYPKKVFTGEGKIYTCINPYSYLIIRKNQTPIHDFDGIFIDGISMCLWIRFIWRRKITRRSFDMTSIAKDFFQLCNSNGESIYLIGAKQEEVSKAVNILKSAYSNLNIIDYRNGYFRSDEEKHLIIQDIINLNPKYVVVGMGTPLQERFLLDLKKNGFEGIGFTCGGFLHQTAKGIEYYPQWIDKYNLRGFYRQYKEKGIFKRNYDTFILFPLKFLIDTIRSKYKSK